MVLVAIYATVWYKTMLAEDLNWFQTSSVAEWQKHEMKKKKKATAGSLLRDDNNILDNTNVPQISTAMNAIASISQSIRCYTLNSTFVNFAGGETQWEAEWIQE